MSLKRILRRWISRLFFLLFFAGVLYVVASTGWLLAFGGRLYGERLARMQRSKHFVDGHFQNPVPTAAIVPGSFLKTMMRSLGGSEQRVPARPIAVSHRSSQDYGSPPASGLRATWMGHATVLVEIDGRRILFDPMWSERGSPSTLFGPKRFFDPPIAIEDLPPLDAVVISHDHYDHLDMRSIQRLNLRQLVFVVPLGVGADLEAWGVLPERILELDWGAKTTVAGLWLTAAPARHYSGRAILDNNRTLWASWIVGGPKHKVFFSGDSGYFDGFKEVGEKYGPFDLSIMKIGAYGSTWPDIHLTPEQALQAHMDLRAGVLLPVHWGTLNLAFHAWNEPAERLITAAKNHGATLAIPRPGELLDVAAPPTLDPWWQ